MLKFLIRNEHQIAEGSGGHYGSRDLTSKLNAKEYYIFKLQMIGLITI